MRIAITGVNGFVGSHLAKLLLSREHKVYGLIRNRSDVSKPMRIKEIHNPDFHLHMGDITDYFSMLKFLSEVQPDIIYHLASQSFVPTSMNNPLDTYNTTLTATLYLLEATRNVCPNARFVFAGSSEEYGAQFDTVQQYQQHIGYLGKCFQEPVKYPETPLNEESFLRPQSPYAVAKVASDFACKNYHQTYGLNTVVARPFNTEGAGRGHHFVTASIVRQIIQLKYGEIDRMKIGNTQARRDWSHVDDIVMGYELLGTSNAVKPGETYVMGSGVQYSIQDFYEMVAEKVGVDLFTKLYIEPSLERKTDVNNLVADATKMKSIVGWRPIISIHNIIKDLIHYYYVPENRKNVLI